MSRGRREWSVAVVDGGSRRAEGDRGGRWRWSSESGRRAVAAELGDDGGRVKVGGGYGPTAVVEGPRAMVVVDGPAEVGDGGDRWAGDDGCGQVRVAGGYWPMKVSDVRGLCRWAMSVGDVGGRRNEFLRYTAYGPLSCGHNYGAFGGRDSQAMVVIRRADLRSISARACPGCEVDLGLRGWVKIIGAQS